MCGRIVIYVTTDNLAKMFSAIITTSNAAGPWPVQANYNVTPTQTIPVVALNGEGERTLVPMRWGLHPVWSKAPPDSSRPLFNARSETVDTKPSFRSAFKRRRALVPANGFYEWVRDGATKQPFYITDPDRPVIAFAAIWEMWRDPDPELAPILSVAILTEAADPGMDRLHHRQPVRLPESAWKDWLSADLSLEDSLQMALSGSDLIFHEVSTEVNSGRAHGEHLILPLGPSTA